MRRGWIAEHIRTVADNVPDAFGPVSQLYAQASTQSPSKSARRACSEICAGIAQRQISKRQLGFRDENVIVFLELLNAVSYPSIVHRGCARNNLFNSRLVGSGLLTLNLTDFLSPSINLGVCRFFVCAHGFLELRQSCNCAGSDCEITWKATDGVVFKMRVGTYVDYAGIGIQFVQRGDPRHIAINN